MDCPNAIKYQNNFKIEGGMYIILTDFIILFL